MTILDGKYRLEAVLGEGTAGSVFRAVHLDLKKTFAVKVLKTAGAPGSRALARFRQEAELLARLRHPAIVEVTDFGVDGETGAAYLVLENLEGRSLAEALRAEGALPLARALAVLEAIAAAVDAAHAGGILHRDLKPANVFLLRDPEIGEPVKVLDFGLAKLFGGPAVEEGNGAEDSSWRAELTAPGGLPGTPLYLAPEVIRGGSTSRASDLYSLGVLAYELLAGHPPFRGSAAEVLAGHLEGSPPPIPGLDPAVFAVVAKMLDKDPARRPASAGAGIGRLRAAVLGVALAHTRKNEGRRRLWLAAGLSGALLLAAAFLPVPALPGLERWLYDWKIRTAPARPPDPRLVLVALDEKSRKAESHPLGDPAWADQLGGFIPRMMAAGARGVAVDLLMPKSWSSSRALSDAVLRHPEALTLAFDGNDGRAQGWEGLPPPVLTALGETRVASLFAFINVDPDPDEVIRRGLRFGVFGNRGIHPSWAAQAAAALGSPGAEPAESDPEFLIDYRIDWRRYPRISWRAVPTWLRLHPEIFRDRLVLIGGTLSGTDVHAAPGRRDGRERIPGLALQALMVDTLGEERPPREAGGPALLWGAAGLAGLALGGILLAPRPLPILAALALLFLLYLALAFQLYHRQAMLLPFTAPGLLAGSGSLAALLLRWRLPAYPPRGLP